MLPMAGMVLLSRRAMAYMAQVSSKPPAASYKADLGLFGLVARHSVLFRVLEQLAVAGELGPFLSCRVQRDGGEDGEVVGEGLNGDGLGIEGILALAGDLLPHFR